jgi:hypothetical protein
MSSVNLAETAAGLPAAWSSRRLGLVGAACVKVLRMDGLPVEEESYGAAEALLVLDGQSILLVASDGNPESVVLQELLVSARRSEVHVRHRPRTTFRPPHEWPVPRVDRARNLHASISNDTN